MRIVADGEQRLPRNDLFGADQLEMRIRVLRKHDMKSIEQDVNTLFRSDPADKKELSGFWPDARGPGEERDIRAVVDMPASLRQRGKAPSHACGDKVTAAEHQISSTDPRLYHHCVKLLEPLSLHMQHDPRLWQPRSDNGDKLRQVHDMDDVAVLPREVRADLADELPIP